MSYLVSWFVLPKLSNILGYLKCQQCQKKNLRVKKLSEFARIADYFLWTIFCFQSPLEFQWTHHFFCMNIFNPYWRTIFKVFYFLFPSCIIAGDQLTFNCRKRIQKVNTLAPQKLVLNSLFLLIETSSVADGSINVGKIYNPVFF